MNWLQKVFAAYYGTDPYYNGYWVDPNDHVYEIKGTHHSWIHDNQDLLRDEYDIDINSWREEQIQEQEAENYGQLLEMTIRDIAFEQEIDETQVVLTEQQEEQIQEEARSDGVHNEGVAIVDLLIENGWLRVSQKSSRIHIEAREDMPRFWDRAEMALIKLFPKVWKIAQYHIIINNREIYSGDLQHHGNLERAVEQESNRNGMAMHWR